MDRFQALLRDVRETVVAEEVAAARVLGTKYEAEGAGQPAAAAIMAGTPTRLIARRML